MRSFDAAAFDPSTLVDAKGTRTVTVCLPAHNEGTTVGAIVSAIVSTLVAGRLSGALVDEIVVVDDGSTDDTAEVARGAGARVVSTGTAAAGKGEAMRTGLASSSGDFVVFLDADVQNFTPDFVTGLLGPLLLDEGGTVALVKAFYERALEGQPSGGGRVTELMARPVIDLLFPHLSAVRQPLAGESAAPRDVLEKTGIDGGYGAELGLLVDVASRFGTGAIVQVDLGMRVHRNRPLHELRHQATDVLRAALERSDVEGARLTRT